MFCPSDNSNALDTSPHPSTNCSINKHYEPIHEDRWRILLAQQEGRDIFLKELDIRRERHDCLYTLSAVESMIDAMVVVLDYCLLLGDVKSAMRISNMANTFYYYPLMDSNGEADICAKCYIHKEKKFQEHAVWRKDGFWDVAMLMGVTRQLDRQHGEIECASNQESDHVHSPHLEDPSASTLIHWDDIESEEELRDLVVEMHNCIFGQLGSIAFTMHDVGLSMHEVSCVSLLTRIYSVMF